MPTSQRSLAEQRRDDLRAARQPESFRGFCDDGPVSPRIARRVRPDPLPLHGWPPGNASEVDRLSDADLETLNGLLPWHCFTADGRGRRFGDRAGPGKREEPQPIPDPRIILMDERFGLENRTVLEVGCFEGVHTVGLCKRGAAVIAVDSRPENVAKTIVRTGLYGCNPRIVVRNLEEPDALEGLEADIAHHVGVLYHLQDPVSHLLRLGAVVEGIMLDTHVAAEAEDSYQVAAETYAFAHFAEGGRADPFSGMRSSAKWLTLDALMAALSRGGFDTIEMIEERQERNGPRVLLFATR